MAAAAKPHKSIGLSNHAVMRAVQRMIGVVVEVDETLFGTAFAMQLHLYAADVTRDEVEQAVLTPFVKAAIWAGATKIRIDEGILIVRGTVVTTLMIDDGRKKRAPKKRFQEQSRRERHRHYQAGVRRGKRKPVSVLT